MAFQPYIKLNINRWKQDANGSFRDEIIIDNQLSADVEFKESVAPSRNSFHITLYNFAIEKDLNLTEGRDRIKVEMGYKDETDTFCFEGVVSKLSYSYDKEEKQCSFDLVDGDDIFEYPVTINEKASKTEMRLSVYSILVRALPKILRDMNAAYKKVGKPELKLQDNLQGIGNQKNLFDPSGELQKFTASYFQFVGPFRDFLNLLLMGTGYGFYIYNNGDYRKLCFFNKGQTEINKEKYMAYILDEDTGLLSKEIKVTKEGTKYLCTSLFLPLLRAGSVIKITTKNKEPLFLVIIHLTVRGDNYKTGFVCEFGGLDIKDAPKEKPKDLKTDKRREI